MSNLWFVSIKYLLFTIYFGKIIKIIKTFKFLLMILKIKLTPIIKKIGNFVFVLKKYNENSTICKIDCHIIVNLPDYVNKIIIFWKQLRLFQTNVTQDW